MSIGIYSDEQVDKLILKNGELNSYDLKIFIPGNTPISQPYWLQNGHNVGIYNVTDQKLIGLPEESSKLICDFSVSYKNHKINFSVPGYYRINDPVDGEIYKPVVITPPVTVNLDKEIYFFANAN